MLGPSSFILLLTFIQLTSCSIQDISNVTYKHDPIHTRFSAWMNQHGRDYKDYNERAQRLEIYRSNLEQINAFNARNLGYTLVDNKFADLTNEEFRAKIKCMGPSPKHQDQISTSQSHKNDNGSGINVPSLPPHVDWRKRGAVTPVKNQGQCGSCWAFAAVAATEGANYIKTKKLISLSEQELVDCDTGSENSGCSGGYMSRAFEFIQQNNGLTTEEDYPYTGDQQACQRDKLPNHSVTISGYMNVTVNNEESLHQAAAERPVSVAIDAGGIGFQFYGSGVFDGPCGHDLNHGVTVVGYGTEGGDHWIVKNSWGENWGDGGYIKMKRNAEDAEGMCGIAKMASYPLM